MTNPRQPCPCGSGKRYKACHGNPGGARDIVVSRPFAGLAAECQLVALREFVPSATAPLPLAPSALAQSALAQASREVTLATLLPMAAAAMVQPDGAALVGLQVLARSGDLSRDLGRAVSWALTAEPGSVLPGVGTTADGEQIRLGDLLCTDTPLQVTLYPDFAWWFADEQPASEEVTAVLQQANAAIMPTEAVTGVGVEAAYWVNAGSKAHLRWVRPEPEEQLLTALAQLAARGELGLGEGSRFAGSFRAHGVVVPVWDLDPERAAQEWVGPAEAFALRLGHTLDALEGLEGTESIPLTDAERRALRGLRGRQLTLR